MKWGLFGIITRVYWVLKLMSELALEEDWMSQVARGGILSFSFSVWVFVVVYNLLFAVIGRIVLLKGGLKQCLMRDLLRVL